jgi:hypothetical protein
VPWFPSLPLQPDSLSFSQEQLASELKSIYTGLRMVEINCIPVDGAYATSAEDNIDTELVFNNWQALIALHCTSSREYHDLFLASQRPSARRH